ncbi:MAG: hypothetical protein QGG64_22725 [Candidatus Latescibacteria bacterium]|nr:hypothetical protein [Candidatus Latescibacterota bacterium]
MLKMMDQRWVFVLVIALVGGCKPIPPTQSSTSTPDVFPSSVDSTYFFANDFQVRVGRRGEIFEGVWVNTPVIFLASLWISAQQQGLFRGNLAWAGSLPFSNYTTRWNGADVGVFHLGPEQVADSSFLWPTEFGAPTQSSGARMLYGDTMVWSALQSDFSQFIPVLAEPIGNLCVTHAVFGYRRSDLRNALFVRYDLKNYGSDPLSNVYVGYYSDTDLVEPNVNAVGYDSERGLTYTYTPAQINTSTSHYVAGYAFLDAPTPTVAHRPIWKADVSLYDETNFFSVQQVGFALQGLTNDGRQMVNPFTGEETRYGLTGDPVAQTGWLDDPRDVRSLISAGPFGLSTNEETSVTVVWVVDKGGSLEEALNKVKAKVDQIRSETMLWSF